jgi:uncharacterized protein (TIGR03118 family)
MLSKQHAGLNNGVVQMRKLLIGVCAACVAFLASAWRAEATSFLQTNLVSNLSGLAQSQDPALQNPWGIALSSTSPFWVSDQAAGVATLYSVNPATNATTKQGLTVAIPTPSVGPTGTVFNSAAASGAFNGDLFMFANLNGSISGWRGALGTTAEIVVPASVGTSYTGLALAPAAGSPLQPLLYAANDAGSGSVNVFSSSFGVPSGLAPNPFATPASISALNLVPFNVQVLNGFVYVTYAPSGHTAQANATAGQGAVAVFNLDGSLVPNTALVVGSPHLAAPWGLAIAPSSFGQFAGDLLVGNFSGINLGISVFDPKTGAFLGRIPINTGNFSSFLWGLSVGNDGSGGSSQKVFFTDGLNLEHDGLFGVLSAVPEPSTWALMLLGFAGLGFAFRQSRRKVSFG